MKTSNLNYDSYSTLSHGLITCTIMLSYSIYKIKQDEILCKNVIANGRFYQPWGPQFNT